MSKSKYEKCTTCGISHGKSVEKTIQHYDKCVENKFFEQINGNLLRMFSPNQYGMYYMYASIGDDCTLNDLDKFLRKEWCECCNHMSQFIDENGDETKKSKKVKSLGLNGRILYEYDMGTTTPVYVELIYISGKDIPKCDRKKCVSVFKKSPTINCKCKKEALYLNDDIPLCQSCKDATECDILFKIENSPRTGVCGYGIVEDETQTEA